MEQVGISEVCVKSEQPVPKQLLPLNEMREHLETNENAFLDKDIADMMLKDVDKYVIDFPEEAVEIMKSISNKIYNLILLII